MLRSSPGACWTCSFGSTLTPPERRARRYQSSLASTAGAGPEVRLRPAGWIQVVWHERARCRVLDEGEHPVGHEAGSANDTPAAGYLWHGRHGSDARHG